MKTVLPSFVFPPISYFFHLAENAELIIDLGDHYHKQTYRNRYKIMAANGLLNLSIPVESYKNHTPLKDIKIAYSENWQKLHWRSIFSAYQSSPFFQYYDYQFEPFFTKNEKYLIDFQQKSMTLILKLLKLKAEISYSENYIEKTKTIIDLRNNFSAKAENETLKFPVYQQVFSEKFPFEKDLSVFDLLFNLGPESLTYLKSIE